MRWSLALYCSMIMTNNTVQPPTIVPMKHHHTNALNLPIGFPVTDFIPPERPDKKVLTGAHCRLEPLDPAKHAADLFASNSLDTEQRIWTYLPYGPFDNEADYTEWVYAQSRLEDPYFYAVVETGNGRAVGVASYLRIDPANGSIEVGHINFSPLLQNTIAATEAMYLMMKNVFDLGYRRYEWKCDALNQPSRNAAIRLGFCFEGIFRQATIYKNRNRDTAWYSIIDKDWPALKPAFEKWLDDENFDRGGQQKQRLSALTATLSPSGREQ